MSTFAYRSAVPPQLRWVTASAPFHVCERSGFSPDRADYLRRQAKLNFTSLERHHKASLSSSLPRSPNEPTPTCTHPRTRPRTRTRSQKASLTDIHRRKPVTCAERDGRVAAAEISRRGRASTSDLANIRTLVNKAAPPLPPIVGARCRPAAHVHGRQLCSARFTLSSLASRLNQQRPGCSGALWVKISESLIIQFS